MVVDNLGPTLFASAPVGGPYRYLALDIETTDGRPEEVERWLRIQFTPPKNFKTPEAIGKRYLEMAESKAQKMALLDTAPVVIVSLQSDSERRCLHCLRAEPARDADGALVEGFATAREMLVALRGVLDNLTSPETELVGHNILGFDLRRLRWMFVREGLRMPGALQGDDQPVFDTMRQYGRLFTVGDSAPFVALGDLLEEFGIPSHKGEMDGSKVPQYVREGRVDELVAYALADVAAEAELYLRMTGQRDDQVAP